MMHRRLVTASVCMAVVAGAPSVLAGTDGRSDETALRAEDLEILAQRMRSDDVETRRFAVQSLLEAEPGSLDALRARLFRDYAPPPARLFNVLAAVDRRSPAGEDAGLLENLLVTDRSENREEIDTNLEILALIRAIAATGHVRATDALVDFSLRERGTYKREIGRVIQSMGARAIPGLIRARKHDDRPTRQWCAWLLDLMGFALPPQAVQQSDNELLAEILLAYSEVHDPDAMRVAVSFTGSERAAVRDAARRAVEAYGQNALWILRQAYENHTGEEPNMAWGWERTTRELYARYDTERLERPNRLLDEGLRHAEKGATREMLAKFQQALALQPSFDRREEMVEPLLDHADDLLEDGEEQEALRISRLALRLAPRGPKSTQLRARIAYLEGRRELAAGVPDEAMFAKAVRLDPAFEPAAEVLERLRRERRRGAFRTAQAALAGGAGLLGLAALLLWGLQRRRRASSGTA